MVYSTHSLRPTMSIVQPTYITWAVEELYDTDPHVRELTAIEVCHGLSLCPHPPVSVMEVFRGEVLHRHLH
ncbi:hypothetical protein M8J76_011765 [Diaphorina citri]|nr:hypothetical protein M8J76_011765 [Diaphorina citri]